MSAGRFWCRICLEEDAIEGHKELTENIVVQDKEIFLKDVLETIAGHKFTTQNPSIPTKVCIKCVWDATNAYIFRKKCSKSIAFYGYIDSQTSQRATTKESEETANKESKASEISENVLKSSSKESEKSMNKEKRVIETRKSARIDTQVTSQKSHVQEDPIAPIDPAPNNTCNATDVSSEFSCESPSPSLWNTPEITIKKEPMPESPQKEPEPDPEPEPEPEQENKEKGEPENDESEKDESDIYDPGNDNDNSESETDESENEEPKKHTKVEKAKKVDSGKIDPTPVTEAANTNGDTTSNVVSEAPKVILDEDVDTFISDIKTKKCNQLNCRFCTRVLYNSYCLRNHVDSHRSYKKYVCKKCGKRDQTMRSHDYHNFMHRKSQQDSVTVSNAEVDELIGAINLKKYTKAICRFCQKQVPSLGALKKHALIHRTCAKYVCDTCNVPFYTFQTYQTHMTKHTESPDQNKVIREANFQEVEMYESEGWSSDDGATAISIKKEDELIIDDEARRSPQRGVSTKRKIEESEQESSLSKRPKNVNSDKECNTDPISVELMNTDTLDSESKSTDSNSVAAEPVIDYKPNIIVPETYTEEDAAVGAFLEDLNSREYKKQTCRICRKKMSGFHQLLRHAELHRTYKKYECKMCGFLSQTLTAHKTHVKTHEVGNESKADDSDLMDTSFTEGVDESVASETTLDFDEGTNAESESPPVEAMDWKPNIVVPETSTEEDVAVDVFMKEIESKEYKKLTCRICRKKMNSFHALFSHVDVHRSYKKYECYVCSYRSQTISGHRCHMKTHEKEHSNSSNSFEVSESNILDTSKPQQSNKADALLRYRLPRVAQRKSKAEVVYWKLQDMEARKRSYVIPPEAVPNIVIPESLTDVDEEVNTFLDEIQNKKTYKKLRCRICTKKLFDIYMLIRHIDIHRSYKKYECKVCGKQTQTITNHKKHVKLECSGSASSAKDTSNNDTDNSDLKKLMSTEPSVDINPEVKPRIIVPETLEQIDHDVNKFINDIKVKKHFKKDCRICSKKLSSVSLLVWHVDVHRSYRKYECRTCGYRSQTMTQFRQHRMTIHNPYPNADTSSKPKIQIPRRRPNERELNSEMSPNIITPKMRTKVDDDVEDFIKEIRSKEHKTTICRFCNKKLSSVHLLLHHVDLHRSYMRYGCKVCGHQTQTRPHFKFHRLLHNQGESKEATAALIQSMNSRSRNSQYSPNIITTEASNEVDAQIDSIFFEIRFNNYKCADCPVCNKKLSNILHLKRHLDLHRTYKRYECKMCGYQSQTMLHHKIHRQTHDEPTTGSTQRRRARVVRKLENPAHAPNILNPKTCTKMDAKVEVFTKEIQSRAYTKPICRICSKKLSNTYQLLHHLDLHRSYKKYECNVCGQKFKTTVQHKQHRILHDAKAEGSSTEAKEIVMPPPADDENPEMEPNIIISEMSTKIDAEIDDFIEEINFKAYRQLVCRICSKKLSNLSILPQHVDLHRSFKKYECKLCAQQFQTISQHKQHRLSHNDDDGSKELSIDEILSIGNTSEVAQFNPKVVFPKMKTKLDADVDDFVAEIKSRKYQDLECRICTNTVSSTCELLHHIDIHRSYTRYECKTCSLQFQTVVQHKQHRISQHDDPINEPTINDIPQSKWVPNPEFTPNIIVPEKITKIDADVDGFIVDIKSKKYQFFDCRMCNKKLSNVYHLLQHVDLHRSYKKYECKLCTQQFQTMSHHKLHRQTHTDCTKESATDKTSASRVENPELEPIIVVPKITTKMDTDIDEFSEEIKSRILPKPVCRICDRKLSSMYQLLVHVDLHRSFKKYKCNVCRRDFKTTVQHKQHRILHGNSTMEAPNAEEKPNIIEPETTTEIDTEVEDFLEELKFTKYQKLDCQICGKKFTDPRTLENHTDFHRTYRRYECTVCRKRFQTLAHHRMHRLSHTNRKRKYAKEGSRTYRDIEAEEGNSSPEDENASASEAADVSQDSNAGECSTAIKQEIMDNSDNDSSSDFEETPKRSTRNRKSVMAATDKLEIEKQLKSRYSSVIKELSIVVPKLTTHEGLIRLEDKIPSQNSFLSPTIIVIDDDDSSADEDIIKPTDSIPSDSIDSKTSQSFKCGICTKTFPDLSHLREHVSSHMIGSEC